MAQVTPPIPCWKNSEKNTRYYEFTRVNPKAFDYLLLINRCKQIKAYLGYVVSRDNGKTRMRGFVVTYHRTNIKNMHIMFPNFNFTYVENFLVSEKDLIDACGSVVINNHRFKGVRKALTYASSS